MRNLCFAILVGAFSVMGSAYAAVGPCDGIPVIQGSDISKALECYVLEANKPDEDRNENYLGTLVVNISDAVMSDKDSESYVSNVQRIYSRLNDSPHAVADLLLQIQQDWDLQFSVKVANYQGNVYGIGTRLALTGGVISSVFFKRYVGLLRFFLYPAIGYYMGPVAAKGALALKPLPGRIPPPPAFIVDFERDNAMFDLEHGEGSTRELDARLLGAFSGTFVTERITNLFLKPVGKQGVCDLFQNVSFFKRHLLRMREFVKGLTKKDIFVRIPTRFASGLVGMWGGEKLASGYYNGHVVTAHVNQVVADQTALENAVSAAEVIRASDRLRLSAQNFLDLMTGKRQSEEFAGSIIGLSGEEIGRKQNFAKWFLSYRTAFDDVSDQKADRYSICEQIIRALPAADMVDPDLAMLRSAALLRMKNQQDDRLDSFLNQSYAAVRMMADYQGTK